MKYHLVVPTIMTNPAQEFKCLDQLVEQFTSNRLDFTLYFVANVPIAEFNNYQTTNKHIVKSISNLEFSISRAINSIYESIKFEDNDILGFIQSDTFFRNPEWIIPITDILHDPSFNAGVLGLRPHASNNTIKEGINFQSKFTIHPCNWADGVMLFTGKTYRLIGGFDENYFGDCESQDFCYQAIESGLTNYWCNDSSGYFGYENRTVDFSVKARFNREEFSRKVEKSRKYLNIKWSQWKGI